jgi:phage shock protein PspC (stress-responsive transcriptional regulator)
MDEDGYQLLENYLKNLRIYFRREEGASEIIADFEARIEELFSERLRRGYEVISIEQVEEVIARVGKPADFSDNNEEDTGKESQTDYRTEYRTEEKETKKSLFRDPDDKMFGGICSGIAAYFGWNVTWVRIIFIVLLFGSQALLLLIYIIGWIVIPVARTAEEKLQMRGKPITVENIGKTVAAEVEKVKTPENRGCLHGIIDLTVGVMKVFMIGLCLLIGLPLIFALFIVFIVLFAVLFGVGGGLLGILPFAALGDSPFLMVNHPVLAAFTFIILLGIPLVALIYTSIAYLAKWKPVNKWVKRGCLGVWIAALILFLCSGFKFNRDSFFINSQERGWFFHSDWRTVEGNGIHAEQAYFFSEPIQSIRTENLSVQLQIEKADSISEESISLIGDENLIDKIEHRIENNRLYLSTGHHHFRSGNNTIIRVRAAELKEIRTESTGNLYIPGAFKADNLKIRLNDAGKFQADSLDVQSLTVDSEGVGSVKLAGTARRADIKLSGVGSIDALELASDTVYAQVGGIGSIKCNPKDYLNGRVNGIGSLNYKEEPKAKDTWSSGIGSIGKN